MNNLTPEQLDMINRLQPFFKERMGEWEHGDSCTLNGYEDIYCIDCIEDNTSIYKDAIRIPKVYDWQNPDRGLWEMIDWHECEVDILHSGKLDFYPKEAKLLINRIVCDDPFTALLKALCEQEGV